MNCAGESALNAVRNYAQKSSAECRAYVEQVCAPFNVDVDMLINAVLSNPITLNFHPDRMANGMLVIDGLIKQGKYHGQFRTGTTNGGKSARIGGDRLHWEQRMFFDAYPPDSVERPKYGALNVFRYADGASVRFGSCYFTLKRESVTKCTFAYGDSSTNPTVLCTSDTFINILAALCENVQKNGKLLDKLISTHQEALAVLLHNGAKRYLGKNLDYCVEAHIHGDVSLYEDVSGLFLDESFCDTHIAEKAEVLCSEHDIELGWIPARQLDIGDIDDLFRGEKIPILAQRVSEVFGGKGVINAALIGKASCDSLANFEAWQDIGDEAQLFQYFKQLWHTVAYFG